MDEVIITISSSTKEFHSLNEVFDSDRLHTGDIVTLHTDVTIGKQVVITKKCTIDLGGHFIFIPIPAGILVKNGVQVNVINGKIQTLSSEQIEDAIIVQGSKTNLVLENTLEVSTRGTAIHVRKRGNLTVDGARVSSTGSQPTIFVDDYDSSFKMNDGTIASYEKSAVVVRSGGFAEVFGGDIYTESNGLIPETTYPAVVVDGKDSKFVLDGGNIFSEITHAVTVQSSSSLEAKSGQIYSYSDDYPVVEVKDGYTSFKVSGAAVYSTKRSAIMSSRMEFGDVQTIQMTDGKVGAVGDILHIAGPGDHDILFSGGKVKGELPQKYIATGYVVSDIKDDEGYAPIILKTWTNPEDVEPVFPGAGDDPDVVPPVVEENPFDQIHDPDVNTDNVAFPNAYSVPVSSEVDLPPEPSTSYLANDMYPPVEEIETKQVNYYHRTEPHISPIPPAYTVPCNYDPPKPPMPENKPVIYNSSVNIRHKTYIYNTPSRKQVIAEWRGALTIFTGGYYSAAGEEFAMVKFRVPGSGKVAIGYVPVYDLSHP